MSQTSEPAQVPKSLLAKGKANDPEAITTMFRQFLMPEEKVFFAEYLGAEGVWGFGTHSFACLTDRRVASLRVGRFGEVIYQDGLLEYINSTVVYQPSKLLLYFLWFIIWGVYTYAVVAGTVGGGALGFALALVLGGLVTFLLMVITARMFYRVRKCGAVWWVREGVSVYVFSNRKRLLRVNALSRMAIHLRDVLISKAHLAPAA